VQRLSEALSARTEDGHRAVVPYLMVDRARARRLPATVAALAEAGAAALELGFPFSDPIADGPTLEAAHGKSLAHGTDWTDLRAQVRIASRRLPTAVMTYANPLWARGLGRATEQLAAAGATGLIVPDLSFEEAGPWVAAARRSRLELVLLVAPSARAERVAEIARRSQGFLYLVSRYGTTGATRPAPAGDLAPLVRAAHRARNDLRVLIGFGVHDGPTARAALSSGADGVVVGSALEEVVGRGASARAVGSWLRRIVRAADAAPSGGRSR
jgi:tryptophan synthase alpha chain